VFLTDSVVCRRYHYQVLWYQFCCCC